MNGGKTTNPDWPDPTEWANRLHQTLAKRQANYVAETDILLKRNKAGNMLARVIDALRELPNFKNESVDWPLKDLLIFLSDLDRGRNHPWSARVNFGGTNITTTATSELKIWVRAVYAVLRANGFKPVEAYRRIAKGLEKSGRTSQKNEPISWRLVQAWCREPKSRHDQPVRKKLESWWVDFRAHHAGMRRKPVPEREIAGRFADQCWSLEHLRDRSVPGVSE